VNPEPQPCIALLEDLTDSAAAALIECPDDTARVR
jgi:hypothetical protein